MQDELHLPLRVVVPETLPKLVTVQDGVGVRVGVRVAVGEAVGLGVGVRVAVAVGVTGVAVGAARMVTVWLW